jgi:glycosyltransferase involved in cell wall biosynthesis
MFGEYGGVGQHVRHLNEQLRIPHATFRLPPWSVYHPIWSRFAWPLEAGRRAFPDPYALAVARRARNFSILHLHAFPFWFEAYVRKAAPSTKRIFTVHQIFFQDDIETKDWPRWRRINETLLASLEGVDRVITVGRWYLPYLRDHGIEATWIPNGIDVAEVQRGNGDRFRQKFGIRADFALTAGTASPYKRTALFLKLAAGYGDRTFVVAGQGADEANLRRLLGAPLPTNVRALGRLSRSDLLDAFAACRVFVLPSAREAFGIVLLEAMALGRPVVAAKAAGPADFLTDRRSGYLFAADDPAALAVRFEEAWNDDGRVANTGQALAVQDFSWPAIAARIEGEYRSLLA